MEANDVSSPTAPTAPMTSSAASEAAATGNTSTAARNNPNKQDGGDSHTVAGSTSNQQATRITLAISQRDAVRMLDASRAFNEALQTLQREGTGGQVARALDYTGTAAPSGSIGGGDGSSMVKTGEEDVVMADANNDGGSKKRSKKRSAAAAASSTEHPMVIPSEQRSPSPMGSTESSDVRTNVSPSYPTAEASTGTDGADPSAQTAPLHKLLLPVAERCTDPFIQSYLRQMKAEGCSSSEIEASLLLFLDVDKSTKLLSAFTILAEIDGGKEINTAADAMDCDEADTNKAKAVAPQDDSNDDVVIDDDEEEIVVSGPLKYAAVSTMLRCFLTSISTCIHRGDDGNDQTVMPPSTKTSKTSSDASPRSTPLSTASISSHEHPWTMSADTRAEIDEIARFAADRLVDHARAMVKARAKALDTPFDESAPEANSVSFEAFGDWYNSGGFKLVPWIELLDLAKWDYAGRAAAAASAAAAKSDRHAQRREAAAAAAAAAVDPLMGVIAEEGGGEDMLLDGVGPITPNVFLEAAGVGRSVRSKKQPSPARDRTVVSFDFTGAMPKSQPFQIRITERNLRTLKDLVTRTGLSDMSPDDVATVLLRHAKTHKKDGKKCQVLRRKSFGRFVEDIMSSGRSSPMKEAEAKLYKDIFSNFFACFDHSCSSLKTDHVNAKELAVGFSFLCAGNKSSKLATAFEMLDDASTGHLCYSGLAQYLRSYLTMLTCISLLDQSPEKTAETTKMLLGGKKLSMFTAIQNGSSWTRDQFIVVLEKKRPHLVEDAREDMTATFEDFAEWYTEGGYTVAPWLELLDLTKFLSLIAPDRKTPRKALTPPAPGLSADILYTFPLANNQSLVVLREDATYVKSVVSQLSLSTMMPDKLWNSLFGHVKKKPPAVLPEGMSRKHKSGTGKSMDADKKVFVSAMEKIIKATIRKTKVKPPPSTDGNSSKETLKNFFSSFDLHQVDRVAANELMGGLTLLCSGKKSTKLAFAFSLFDGRPEANKKGKKRKPKKGEKPQEPNSLAGKELFLFLRSFLIVMFSCCKQSLDLSAEEVSRYIYDTAHVIAQDVMKFQWNRSKKDRINFDEFGEWYNEGGFETAPWLELLDLNKWVYAKEEDVAASNNAAAATTRGTGNKTTTGTNDDLLGIPPPPPDDDFLDPNDPFFSDDINMDGIDEIDFMAIAEDMHDKENAGKSPKNAPTQRDSGDPDTTTSGPKSDSTGSSSADTDQPSRTIAASAEAPPTLVATSAAAAVSTEHGSPKPSAATAATDTATSTASAAPISSAAQIPKAAPLPVPAPAAKSQPPPQQQPQPQPQPQQEQQQHRPVVVPAHPPAPSLQYQQSRQAAPVHGGNQSMVRPRPQPAHTNPHSHQHPHHHPQSLKFHLITAEPQGGYLISISQRRVRHLRHLVIESGLCKIDGAAACSRIMEHASKSKTGATTLSRQQFNAAIHGVFALSKTSMSPETKRSLLNLFMSLYASFDRDKNDTVNALEIAAGFTVLCGGRKSDKLEQAFDLLDSDKDGKLSYPDVVSYLKAFLTALMRISTSNAIDDDEREIALLTMKGVKCPMDDGTIQRAIGAGSEWATAQVYNAIKPGKGQLDFDAFADWYTGGGYASMPWIELLDLRKWCLTG